MFLSIYLKIKKEEEKLNGFFRKLPFIMIYNKPLIPELIWNIRIEKKPTKLLHFSLHPDCQS